MHNQRLVVCVTVFDRISGAKVRNPAAAQALIARLPE
jgi:hypothetical protein